jgi:hypothetical protein
MTRHARVWFSHFPVTWTILIMRCSDVLSLTYRDSDIGMPTVILTWRGISPSLDLILAWCDDTLSFPDVIPATQMTNDRLSFLLPSYSCIKWYKKIVHIIMPCNTCWYSLCILPWWVASYRGLEIDKSNCYLLLLSHDAGLLVVVV